MGDDYRGFRTLAAAVVKCAIDDVGGAHPVIRTQARAWLMSPTSAPDRELWCSWLGIDDGALARLLDDLDDPD